MLILPAQTSWEAMEDEYRALGLYPKGHLMGMLREHLDNRVLTSQELLQLLDGTPVVAGLVVRRQRPLGKTVYITLEDEFGHSPLEVDEPSGGYHERCGTPGPVNKGSAENALRPRTGVKCARIS